MTGLIFDTKVSYYLIFYENYNIWVVLGMDEMISVFKWKKNLTDLNLPNFLNDSIIA